MTKIDWISVDVELPPVGSRESRVMVWTDRDAPERFEFAWRCEDGRWLSFDLEYDLEVFGVTHWAYPPQGPQE